MPVVQRLSLIKGPCDAKVGKNLEAATTSTTTNLWNQFAKKYYSDSLQTRFCPTLLLDTQKITDCLLALLLDVRAMAWKYGIPGL